MYDDGDFFTEDEGDEDPADDNVRYHVEVELQRDEIDTYPASPGMYLAGTPHAVRFQLIRVSHRRPATTS